MLYLKTCNNLVYVDFTKKDFSDFIYKHGKDNVNKITLIVNEIEPTCLYWISRIASIEKYNKIKFIINTVSYTKLYLDFIRKILKEFPLLRKRSKINGGLFSISCNNVYYSFYKDGYYLQIHKRGDGFGGYSERVSDEYICCDMFEYHGACVYGPSSMYNGREYKWKYMLQLATAMTGSKYRTVNKEQSMDIYHKYLTHQFYQFNELKGKKGKLPDGTIVDMSKLYVSPPTSNDSIGDFNTVTICRKASSSCESMYMDD